MIFLFSVLCAGNKQIFLFEILNVLHLMTNRTNCLKVWQPIILSWSVHIAPILCLVVWFSLFNLTSPLVWKTKLWFFPPPQLFVFSNFKNFQLMNLKFDGYFDKSFLQTLSLQLPPSGGGGEFFQGGEGGEFDKNGMPHFCKNSKEGRRISKSGV